MKQPFIETRGYITARNSITQTIKANGFLAVVAEVGSGKTTMHNRFVDYWIHDAKRRFIVVALKGFTKTTSRISQIMKLMIEACDPEAYIPGSVERQYTALSQALQRAAADHRKVILVIDEAQDLNLQTFRDLKKIHEIHGASEHLFSIILFGKTHRTWERIFALPELGHRIEHVRLMPLSEEEIVLIAQKRFGLVFSVDHLKSRFASAIRYKTPLGVQHLVGLLRTEWPDQIKNDLFYLKLENIAALPRLDLRYRLRQSSYTQRDIVHIARTENPELKGINPQRVSDVLNGKADEQSEIAKAIIHTMESRLSGLTLREEEAI
jgi:hypothetical protein